MALLAHILIALGSIAFSTYLMFSPSRARLLAAYGSVVATIASGGFLVVASHAPIMRTCLTGIAYVAVVMGLLAVAGSRLTKLGSSPAGNRR